MTPCNLILGVDSFLVMCEDEYTEENERETDMTTTNPNTTDYGMFTEEGNVAVHEIVVNAVDVPSALEELVQLASIGLGPGWRHPMGEATDTEVFDAVAYAVEERLKGAPKLTLSAVIFDLEKQKVQAYRAAKVATGNRLVELSAEIAVLEGIVIQLFKVEAL